MTNTTQTGTVAHAMSLVGAEKAHALDLLDAEPIDRLTEDDVPTDVEWGHEGDPDEDWFWGLSTMNNG